MKKHTLILLSAVFLGVFVIYTYFLVSDRHNEQTNAVGLLAPETAMIFDTKKVPDSKINDLRRENSSVEADVLHNQQGILGLSEKIDELIATVQAGKKQQEATNETLLEQQRELTALRQHYWPAKQQAVNDDDLDHLKTEEEIAADEKIRIEGIVNNLEATWQMDEAIAGQAATVETEISEIFARNAENGIQLLQANCKSRYCKIETQQSATASNDSAEVLFSYATMFANSESFSQSYSNPDGSTHLIMYVTLGAETFPEEVFN